MASCLASAPHHLENAPVYSFGHSYTMPGNPYITKGSEYQKRVAQRLGMGAVTSHGRSGTFLQENFARALSPRFDGTTQTWEPGSRGVVLIQNYMNEASNAAVGGDPTFQTEWRQALRSLIALLSSSRKIPFAAAQTSGTWTRYGATYACAWSDGDVRFTSQAGAEARFTVTGDEAWVVSNSAMPGYASGPVAAFVGNTQVGSFGTQGKRAGYTSTVTGQVENHAPMAYRITGMNAAAGTTGTKTLTLRALENKNTFINCVLLPSVTPPRVFIAKEPPRSPGATAGAPTFAANDAAYRALVDQVVSEFPNVHAVDLAPDWDNDTMVASLDVQHKFHPNDLGMAHIASRFASAIRENITAPDPGVMTL